MLDSKLSKFSAEKALRYLTHSGPFDWYVAHIPP